MNNIYISCMYNIGDKERGDLKNKKNILLDEYINSFKILITKVNKLIVFVDNEIYKNIKIFENNNIKIINIELEKTYFYKYKNEIVNALKKMDEKNIKNSLLFKTKNYDIISLYIIIISNKIWFFEKVKEIYKDIKQLIWIDFGVFRHKNMINENYIFKNENIKKTDKMLLFINSLEKNIKVSINNININDTLYLINKSRTEIGATIFIINREYVSKIFDIYDKKVKLLLENNTITTEQGILTLIAKDNNDLFDYIQSSYNNVVMKFFN